LNNNNEMKAKSLKLLACWQRKSAAATRKTFYLVWIKNCFCDHFWFCATYEPFNVA